MATSSAKMAPTPENTIDNVLPSKSFFVGEGSATGQLDFVNNGLGYYHLEPSTGSPEVLGSSITLACGLTECCMQLGRGKVSFTPNPLGQMTEFHRSSLSRGLSRAP